MNWKIACLWILSSVCIASTVNAAALYEGAAFYVKVIGSSTGAPCESDCWERWQESTGRGAFMVVKDATGRIVDAGRISEAFFADLYYSTDEAIRNIPTAQQVVRYGRVKALPQWESCNSNCVTTLDFGTNGYVMIGLNLTAKIGGVTQIGGPLVPPQAPLGSPADNLCPNNQPGVGCNIYSGPDVQGGHQGRWYAILDQNGHVIGWIWICDHEQEHRVPRTVSQ